MGDGQVYDNCGIDIDVGVCGLVDRRIVPQPVGLFGRFEDTQARTGGASTARILKCPDGLWTIAQQAVAQLPGTGRRKLSNKGTAVRFESMTCRWTCAEIGFRTLF